MIHKQFFVCLVRYFISIRIICLVFQTQKLLAQETSVDFSNPVLISGSSFGNVFQQFYKIGDYESLIKLTSQSSLHKFGKDIIQKYYKEMQFGYPLKLRSLTKLNGIYTLNYVTTINALIVVIRMDVVTERDSCRIVLKDNFLKQKIFLYK
jgi:hypothetical protein